MTRRTDVLVVGAGPTGLTLALQAHDHGARVRIVERRTDVFRPSRALTLHPRTLSQLRVAYLTSPLSVEGKARWSGGQRAGRRLPDAAVTVDGRHVRLHTLLAEPGVHILLGRDAPPLEQQCFETLVTIHRLTSQPGDGVMAIRPDGYIGFRGRSADRSQLQAWFARIGTCCRASRMTSTQVSA